MSRLSVIIAALLAAALFLSGCGVCRPTVGTNTQQRDSTATTVNTQVIERIDTAYVEIPVIKERLVTRDTTSLIENEFAVSRASILADGQLYHDLETKPAKRPVTVKTVTVVRDSLVYRDREKVVETTVEVEKPMSRALRYQIIGFWLLLVGVVAAVAIKIRKLF